MSGLPSRFPYVFEPGMSVRVIDHASPVLVTMVDNRDRGMWISFRDARLYVSMRDCMADLDHPGTRGLLLEQYRRASEHEHACVSFYRDVDDDDDRYDDSPGWFEGPWGVEVNDGGVQRRIVGEGDSEGAAILDALTRLAAEREAKAESEPMKPAELANRLERIERRLRAIEDALAKPRKVVALRTPEECEP